MSISKLKSVIAIFILALIPFYNQACDEPEKFPQDADNIDQVEGNPVSGDESREIESFEYIDQTGDFALYANESRGRVDYEVEREECEGDGWSKHVIDVQVEDKTYGRKYLFKAPERVGWTGSLLILHGGSGNYTDWCAGPNGWNSLAIEALDRGYGVFLLDSTDIAADNAAFLCGKVWDDRVNKRNLDLPYISKIIEFATPKARPSVTRSGHKVFVTGFSSGGFMATRAGTSLNHLIDGFAPIGSGSPYGWHRDCEYPAPNRPLVNGKGIDNDEGLEITEANACGSYQYDVTTDFPAEEAWETGGANTTTGLRFLKVHHKLDGITDYSCHQKVLNRLVNNGYQGDEYVSDTEYFNLGHIFRRRGYHWYFSEYTDPILDFFDSLIAPNN